MCSLDVRESSFKLSALSLRSLLGGGKNGTPGVYRRDAENAETAQRRSFKSEKQEARNDEGP
jgi:hypothetical protein